MSDSWEKTGVPDPETPEMTPDSEDLVIHSPKRYTNGGRRKGRFAYAAPLGLLVIALAVTGVVSLTVWGIGLIKKGQDDTTLRAELYDFLTPVMMYYPIEPFESVLDNKQDALILAAMWRITDRERIRMLREKDDVYGYPLDDMSRAVVPVEKVNTEYAALFGSDAIPYHHTIGEAGLIFTFEYSEEQVCYFIPASPSDSQYEPVLDTLKKSGDKITVRVGYVPIADIGVDEKGKTVSPTPAMAAAFESYTVQKTETGWKLVSAAKG